MPFKRYVEIGRVALINFGEDYGKLVVITDVVDQNRVSAGGGGLAGSTVGCTLVGCVFGRFEGFCGVAWLAAAVVGAQAAAWVFWVCLGGGAQQPQQSKARAARALQQEHLRMEQTPGAALSSSGETKQEAKPFCMVADLWPSSSPHRAWSSSTRQWHARQQPWRQQE